jgi:AcrR family transcriptional regulator
MNTQADISSKEKILESAIRMFAQKGKHGTKIDEIARDAGINKALVYYYFTSKDNLFFEILKTIFTEMYQNSLHKISEDISNGKNHVDIISNSIRYSFESYNNNPDYTRIMIDAISNGMEEIPKALEIVYNNTTLSPASYILNTIQDGVDKNIFREVDPVNTMISITGMTFIYFLSRNIIKFFGMNIENEEDFINNRVQSVIDLIMNGMLKRN